MFKTTILYAKSLPFHLPLIPSVLTPLFFSTSKLKLRINKSPFLNTLCKSLLTHTRTRILRGQHVTITFLYAKFRKEREKFSLSLSHTHTHTLTATIPSERPIQMIMSSCPVNNRFCCLFSTLIFIFSLFMKLFYIF